MRKSHLTVVLVFGFTCLIVAGGWYLLGHRLGWRDNHAAAPAPMDRPTVRIGVAKAVLTAPAMIAYHRGFFAENGLDVVYLDHYSSGKTAFEGMLAGEVDVCTVATTPAVVYSFQRNDFSLFVTHTTTFDGVKIVVRLNDSKSIGVSPERYGDLLRNRRIGVVNGTISQFLLNSFLSYTKISLEDVTTVDFDAALLPEALHAGEVDAISVWEPEASEALDLLPTSAVRIPAENVYRMAINLAVMRDFAEENPDVLVRIVRAMDQATRYLHEERQSSIDVLLEQWEIGEDYLISIWDQYTHSLALDQLLLLTMENEARWLIDNEYTEAQTVPNYLSYIYTDALETVDPDAIKLIR